MFYDSLTGLPNVMLFLDRLQQAVAHAARRQQTIGLLYMDIDGFKRIVDFHGLAAGDNVMKEVAQRLRHCMQRQDDTVARLCGDQFAMILGDINDIEGARKVLDKITGAMKQAVVLEGQEQSVTLSIGASIFPQDGKDWSSLLQSASVAMHQGKSAGGNRYFCCGEEKNENTTAGVSRRFWPADKLWMQNGSLASRPTGLPAWKN